MDIKKERKLYKVTQYKLSEETGIPRDRIAKWEQGKGSPKADDHKTLTDYFESKKGEQVPKSNAVENPQNASRQSKLKRTYVENFTTCY